MKSISTLLSTLLISLAIFSSANAQAINQPIFSSESLTSSATLNVENFSAGIQANLEIPFTDYSLSSFIATTGVVVTIDDDKKPHRGRIQIQGPDMEEEISWAWSQDTPPTKADGLREPDKLYNSLTKKQKKARKDAYAKARKWIRELPESGVDAQVSKSWGNKDDSSKRIDIAVIKGKAFTGKDPEAEDDDETTIEVVGVEEGIAQ